MKPSEVVARSLDWVNVKGVRWRLSGHRPPPMTAAEVAPEPPAGVPRLASRTRAGEIWKAEAGDWIAERLPARAGAERVGAVVLLHGWMAATAQFAFYRWLSAPLRDRFDVWMPRLPEHGERTTEGAFPGELCLCGGEELTVAQLRRAVAETRWLTGHLADTGVPVALWGISLGGWVAALSGARDEASARLLWAPVLDPRATLEESQLGAAIVEHAAATDHGAFDTALDDELSPLRRADSDGRPWNALIVGGRYDDIAPPEVLERAGERTGARVEILEHGHISLLASPRARRLGLSFLRDQLAPLPAGEAACPSYPR